MSIGIKDSTGITIRDCVISNCGGGVLVRGDVTGLHIDGLDVVDTPTVLEVQGSLTESSVRRVRHTVSDRTAVQRRVAPPTPGRNDPCHCGSGRKYKKCCGR